MNNLGEHSSKTNQRYSSNERTNDPADTNLVTIHERINLTKEQCDVLKTICHTYEESISDYMQEALIEAMRFDIEEGNFCDNLLQKLDNNGKARSNSSSSSHPTPNPMNGDLDLLNELQSKRS
jgi:hypothetical protein